MADCLEVVSRKNLRAILQAKLEATVTTAYLDASSNTLLIAEYPAFWPMSGIVQLLLNGIEPVYFASGWGSTTLIISRTQPTNIDPGAAVTLYSNTPSRIFCGVKDLAISDDFFNALVSKGPAIQIRWAGRAKQDYQGHFVYVVPIRIYYGYARNEDNDGFAIENLNSLIFQTVADRSNYIGATKGSPPASDGVEYPEYLEDTENETGVCVRYEMRVPFDGATN